MNLVSRGLRNPIGWAVLLVLVVLACASVFSIVPETAQALVVRMGQPLRVVNGYRAGERFGEDGAGLIAHVPLVEQVVFVDKRVRDLEVTRQPLVTADGQRFQADALARYRIVDPLRMYLAERGDGTQLADALKQALASTLATEAARGPATAFMSAGSGGFLATVRDAVDRVGRQYGVRVLDIRIGRLVLPEGSATDDAFTRMRAGRQQDAAAIRMEGARQAALVRAQADQKAAQAYADAFGRDAQFYDFYRSMQSYRTSFGVDGTTEGGTTIVLPADSAYLRNFFGRSAR